MNCQFQVVGSAVPYVRATISTCLCACGMSLDLEGPGNRGVPNHQPIQAKPDGEGCNVGSA